MWNSESLWVEVGVISFFLLAGHIFIGILKNVCLGSGNL